MKQLTVAATGLHIAMEKLEQAALTEDRGALACLAEQLLAEVRAAEPALEAIIATLRK